jgi:hypothetical protein
MRPDARLLIVEMVLPPGDVPHPGKILDMVMLALIGGQERTQTEYARLLDKAGFRLSRVVPTQSLVSVVEAILAMATLGQEGTLTCLFNHFICAYEEGRRNRETKRPCGSHVDGEVKVGRALER